MTRLTAQQLDLLENAEAHGAQLRDLGEEHPGGRVNRELVRALGERGLLRRLFARGDGISAMDLCLLRQGLARTSTAAETALAMQGLGSYPVFQSASAEVIDRWIPGIASGEIVAAFALTEPEAGSDAGNLQLRAQRDGEGFRLSGEKAYISNAPDADLYTVFARTSEGSTARGVTAFLVPGDSPGLGGEPIAMMSPHPVGSLTFDAVPVPAEHVLGELDHGFGVAMRTLDLFRPSVGAYAVGMAETALRAAAAYAAQREAFGRAIGEFQGVSHKLADMATRIDASRLLVYRAALAYDSEEEGVTGYAAMAKLFATETAQFVVDAALQIHGARGLEEDHVLAHLYREVRAPRIYEGTSEIQRNIIARELQREHLRS